MYKDLVHYHCIAESYYKGVKVKLFEHDFYGDEAPMVIVDINGKVLLDDVRNGFADLDDIE